MLHPSMMTPGSTRLMVVQKMLYKIVARPLLKSVVQTGKPG